MKAPKGPPNERNSGRLVKRSEICSEKQVFRREVGYKNRSTYHNNYTDEEVAALARFDPRAYCRFLVCPWNHSGDAAYKFHHGKWLIFARTFMGEDADPQYWYDVAIKAFNAGLCDR